MDSFQLAGQSGEGLSWWVEIGSRGGEGLISKVVRSLTLRVLGLQISGFVVDFELLRRLRTSEETSGNALLLPLCSHR